MSLKTRFISILTAAISIAAFSTFAFAQDDKAATTIDGAQKRVKGDRKGHHEGRGKGMRHGRAGRHGGFQGLRGLELTDAQKEQVRAIRESNKPDAAVMEEMRAVRESRKAGTELTAAQKERLSALREQFATKRKAMHEQILGVLTAEQRTQLETRKTEMKQRHEQMKQRFQERKLQRQQEPATTTPVKTKVS